jgi:hypothetical protein
MIVYILKCCLQLNLVYTGNGSVLVAARLHNLDKYTDTTEEVSSSTHMRPSPPKGRQPPSVQIEISVQRYLSRVGLGAATIDLFAQVYLECVLSLYRMCCLSICEIEYVLSDNRPLRVGRFRPSSFICIVNYFLHSKLFFT